MVCLFLTLFLACVSSLLACPEPLNVHIQNYEGPIILHTGNCDSQRNNGEQQLGNYGYQCKQNGCYDTECNCVSKQSYAPYVYGGSTASNVGSGCCPVADVKPLVYCICSSCGSDGYSNNLCGNQGYQSYPSCQSKPKEAGCC